jgi:hypothetical protein
MSKSKSAGKAKVPTAKKLRKAAEHHRAIAPKQHTNSKQTDVVEMLRQPHGATISAIMKATGWQQHSVRGFFAGIVRKKLGLTLESQKPDDGDRVYRLAASKPDKPKSKASKPNRRAA